jgi:hypothetical protein
LFNELAYFITTLVPKVTKNTKTDTYKLFTRIKEWLKLNGFETGVFVSERIKDGEVLNMRNIVCRYLLSGF